MAKVDRYNLQAQWLKALAHPARLQILEVVREGEACVCHLEATLGYRQAYLSQHLAVLRRAGLLAERKDGLFVFYRIAGPEVGRLLEAAQAAVPKAAAGNKAVIHDRPRPAGSKTQCDCPHCREARQN